MTPAQICKRHATNAFVHLKHTKRGVGDEDQRVAHTAVSMRVDEREHNKPRLEVGKLLHKVHEQTASSRNVVTTMKAPLICSVFVR